MFIKNTLLSCFYYLGAAFFARRYKLQNRLVTVLSLHRVGDWVDPCWQPLSCAGFEKLLGYVRRHYQVCTFAGLGAWLEKPSWEKPPLILSFDDGYADFIQNALPLLQKYGLPCNHNLVLNCLENGETIWTQQLNSVFNHLIINKINQPVELGAESYKIQNWKNWYPVYRSALLKMLSMSQPERSEAIAQAQKKLQIAPIEEKMMSWDDAKHCLQTGLVELGSHTVSHESLPTLSDETALWAEIDFSKKVIGQKLSIELDILALPNGQNSPKVSELAQKAGYRWLLETGDVEFVPASNANSAFQIVPRINIEEEKSPMIFMRAENFPAKISRFLQKMKK